MELQDAIKHLNGLVNNDDMGKVEGEAWQSIKIELDSMQHRLGAWERQDGRHNKELERLVSYQQGATRAYESIIEGLAKLLQEGE